MKFSEFMAFIIQVTLSIDEGHICDEVVHYRKLQLRTLRVKTFLNSNYQKDTVLQTGAREYH